MGELFEDTRPIKALSLWQPWASLVAKGAKIHETRHWFTDYRGRLAIHAAKTLDVAGSPDTLCMAAFGPFWEKNLPAGAIVAIGELVGCHKAELVAGGLTRANLAAGNFAAGRFAWALDRVRPLLEPIPFTGRQGLFNWTAPADLECRLGEPVDHAAFCKTIGWA